MIIPNAKSAITFSMTETIPTDHITYCNVFTPIILVHDEDGWMDG